MSENKPSKKILELQSREARMVQNMDAFISSLTGAGYSDDKFTSYSFWATNDLDDQTLENLYTDHDIAATIVDRIVRDALRSGYELDWPGASDQQRREVVDWAESTYSLTQEVEQARIYSRLYGGGGVFIGTDGALSGLAIQGAPIRFLRAVSSRDLKGDLFYSDPGKQNYGERYPYNNDDNRAYGCEEFEEVRFEDSDGF